MLRSAPGSYNINKHISYEVFYYKLMIYGGHVYSFMVVSEFVSFMVVIGWEICEIGQYFDGG